MTTLMVAAAVLVMLTPGIRQAAYQPQERRVSGRR